MRESYARPGHLLIFSLADTETPIAIEKILPFTVSTTENSCRKRSGGNACYSINREANTARLRHRCNWILSLELDPVPNSLYSVFLYKGGHRETHSQNVNLSGYKIF